MYVPLGLIAIAILVAFFVVLYVVHRHDREKQQLRSHVKELEQELLNEDDPDAHHKEALLREALTDKEIPKE
jgi:hypothetical protein